MGFTEFSQNVFSGNSFEKEKPDYHTITTDHPWMIQLGLGSFTTGILQKWWDVTDQNGVYKNRPLFGPFSGPYKLLDSFDDVRGHHFDAWRQQQRNYIKYNDVSRSSSNWTFAEVKDGQTVRTHQWSLIGFSFFNDTLYTKVDANDDPLNTAAGGHTNIDTSICNIIEMNNYVRLKKTYTPDETTWISWDRARAEFIRDIKSAKMGGGVTWSGYLPFEFNINSLTNCTKYDWVKFNLQLFDSNRPKQTNRALAVSDFKIAGTPIDVMGQAYANRTKEDGEFGQASIKGNTEATAVGDLDKSFNEYTGQWQAGSPQIIARLMSDIPSAVNESNMEPSVEAQYSAKISDLLTKEHASYQHAQTGTAMPITMQNGNPMQWAPQYAEPKGCRKNENKKTVTVVNLAPRAWASGQIVMLNKVEGVWFPLEFGDPTEAIGKSRFDGKWDFTYLLSNAEYYFETGTDGVRFHYEDYEKSFYKDYYTGDAKNAQENIGRIVPQANVDDDGYLQITSWDFMGDAIGGKRAGGHALGQTIFEVDVDGNGIGEAGDGKRVAGMASSPFFGCVFPGGYNGESIYSLYKNTGRNIDLKTKTSPTVPFFQNVAKDVDVFATTPNQVNRAVSTDFYDGPIAYDTTSEGMFATQNSNLLHLPADIATNASPNGVHGRPISDIRAIAFFINNRYANIQANCFNYFSAGHKYAWMYQDVDGADDSTVSAFDLEPKNKNIIEFRPLTRETFNCLEVQALAEYNAAPDTPRSIGYFGKAAQENLKTKGEPVINPGVLDRTILGIPTKLSSDNTGQRKLLYGRSEIQANGYQPEAGIYSFGPYGSPLYFTDATSTGGGAVGVITAICTASAPSKIVFNTSTYIGVQTHGLQSREPAHGGNQRPQDFGCTSLHARVFTAWPRDLTVYDSRFFCVFHFNYGAGEARSGRKWHFNGNEATDQNLPASPVLSYPDGYYEVDESYSEVDFRVPTLDTASPAGDIAADGSWVNQLPNLGGSPFRRKKDWRIYGGSSLTAIEPMNGAQRRGKLLPLDGGYNYVKRTIGISKAAVGLRAHVAAAGSTILASDRDIMIVKQGTGYSKTDEFKVTGAGHSVVLHPDTNGPVTNFIVADVPITLKNGTTLTNPQSGADFQAEDFLRSDEVLDGTNIPGAKIIPVTSTGEGFEGYVVRGRVQDSPILTDLGPKEVTNGAERLTSDPEYNQDDIINQPVLDDLKEKSVNTAEISDKNEFDIYLFFHNDPSHHAVKTGDSAGKVQFFQSRVRTEILPE